MIEKILERLEKRRNDVVCIDDDDYFLGKSNAFEEAIEIVQEVAKEYDNGWIPCSERLPSKEECGNFARAWFQVTIPQHNCNETTVMQYEYTTIRGKETARWLWYGRIASVEPIAWKFLDAPYQKGE